VQEPANKPEEKVPGMQISFWLPLVAGAVAFVGALLLMGKKETSVAVERSAFPLHVVVLIYSKPYPTDEAIQDC
jgi:hypothetical protein